MIKYFIESVQKEKRIEKIKYLNSCDDSSRYVNIHGLSDGFVRLQFKNAVLEIKYVCPLYFIYACFYPLLIDRVRNFIISSFYECYSNYDDDFKINFIHDFENNSLEIIDVYYKKKLKLDYDLFRKEFIETTYEIINLYEALYPGIEYIPEIKSMKDLLLLKFPPS